MNKQSNNNKQPQHHHHQQQQQEKADDDAKSRQKPSPERQKRVDHHQKEKHRETCDVTDATDAGADNCDVVLDDAKHTHHGKVAIVRTYELKAFIIKRDNILGVSVHTFRAG